MSEQGSNGDNGNKRDESPDPTLMFTNALKTELGKFSSNWKRIRPIGPINSKKHDASSAAVAKKEACGHDDKNNDLPKKNDKEGSMSNDAMQKLEESFVMVESFTAASPKTTQFELVQVEKDEEQAAQDDVAKEQ